MYSVEIKNWDDLLLMFVSTQSREQADLAYELMNSELYENEAEAYAMVEYYPPSRMEDFGISSAEQVFNHRGLWVNEGEELFHVCHRLYQTFPNQVTFSIL